jgi:hypothetical protein
VCSVSVHVSHRALLRSEALSMPVYTLHYTEAMVKGAYTEHALENQHQHYTCSTAHAVISYVYVEL